MLDIASISAIVAAVGVTVGVVLAILQLRDLVKTRQADLFMRLYLTWTGERLQQARQEIMAREFKDYDDAVKKYGSWSKEVFEVALFLEGIGVLLHRKLIDIGLVDDLFCFPVKSLWEKLEPITEGYRNKLNRQRIFEWFEYLYNEMQKREQQLAKNQ